LIRRRHVIYVEGYDPQGAEGYYNLFERAWRRFVKIWAVDGKLGGLQLDSADFAHWDVEAAGPNWRVTTRYDFLRQEQVIRANMAEPSRRQIPRSLAWTFDYLISGALFRVFRASWPFGVVLVYFQLSIIGWLVMSAGGGYLAALAALNYLDLPNPVAAVIGVAAGAAIFAMLRQVANRNFVTQINSHWPYLCEFARGEASCFDAPIEACARRLIEVARANTVDEIIVVGHSGGGALAPAVVTRALELDPEVGRRGPLVVLLTLGSIAPGAALHPKATRLRGVFARLAVEPSVTWIDAQARKDVLNFWDFDPVAGLGIDAGAARCNPTIWRVRFRDILSAEFYRRIRFNFFRLHYQFIMANDRCAPYDYFMLVAGPIPVATWASDPFGAMCSFGPNGELSEAPASAPAVQPSELATPSTAAR
jgi:hypothetical protein